LSPISQHSALKQPGVRDVNSVENDRLITLVTAMN